ncbi:CDP-alcohol phosphatidyltransferase [Carpediemonas membranifera]|uniref:CDP-alcohol phosphatidyltransferase n=1 Tax=Carpediemonas membranifera TaxID=201153 RepID=A0A8J6E0N2_9EUKA|nr:CDP-alcohol phosphatidyltransferase [Carpediemonas membranifera]|eukprot:KAG9395334.1 CDP-alcohol phosphatidyltransferase [Carpediemonas membranifera]
MLTPAEKTHLLNYKYQGGDNSLLMRFFLRPFIYNPIVRVLPKNLAPNVITVVGILATVIGYLVTIYVFPQFPDEDTSYAPVPWLSFLLAACLFIYQTCDNIDGPHARNIACCSHVGDFLDHAGDQIAFFTFITSLTTTFFTGPTLLSAFSVLSVMWAGWFAQWETLYMGKLVLAPINGCMEGIFTGVMIHVGFGLFPDIPISHVTLPAVGTVSVGQVIALVSAVGGVTLGPTASLVSVFKKLGPRAYARSLMTHFPYLVLNGLCFATALLDPAVRAHVPHAWMSLHGVLICYIIMNLIIHRLVGRPFPLLQPAILLAVVPFAVAVSNKLNPVPFEVRVNVMVICAVFAAVMFAVKFLKVASDISAASGKPLWTVPKTKRD